MGGGAIHEFVTLQTGGRLGPIGAIGRYLALVLLWKNLPNGPTLEVPGIFFYFTKDSYTGTIHPTHPHASVLRDIITPKSQKNVLPSLFPRFDYGHALSLNEPLRVEL